GFHTISLDTARSQLSHPFLDPEDDIEGDAEAEHEPQRHRVSDGPVELGHAVEVHSVDRADERGREADCAPAGDLLYVLVLALGDAIRDDQDFIGWDLHWYSAQPGLDLLLVGLTGWLPQALLDAHLHRGVAVISGSK